jgi:hypothetical protein
MTNKLAHANYIQHRVLISGSEFVDTILAFGRLMLIIASSKGADDIGCSIENRGVFEPDNFELDELSESDVRQMLRDGDAGWLKIGVRFVNYVVTLDKGVWTPDQSVISNLGELSERYDINDITLYWCDALMTRCGRMSFEHGRLCLEEEDVPVWSDVIDLWVDGKTRSWGIEKPEYLKGMDFRSKATWDL